MITARGMKWTSGLLAAVVLAASAQVASAQSTKMPSTLRYGSGYLDVPSASVITAAKIIWVKLACTNG